MKKTLGILLILVLVVSISGQTKEPERVTVQHILIAFKGSIPNNTQVTRTKEEAGALAVQILNRGKNGEDFDALVKEYTDDRFPGIYAMSNFGVEAQSGGEIREFPRSGMVKSFGDVSFSLPVDGLGIAIYHPENSKYGWHIIKRLK